MKKRKNQNRKPLRHFHNPVEKVEPFVEMELRGEAAVEELIAAMRLDITSLTTLPERLNRSRRVLKCRWDGQSADGLKHEDALGERPLPWEGASDARVRLANGVVRELSTQCLAAMRLATSEVIPTGGTPPEMAGVFSAVMAHYFHGPMRENLAREMRLAARYAFTFPCVVVHVDWEEEEMVEAQEITGGDLASMALSLRVQDAARTGRLDGLTEADAPQVQQALAQETEDELRLVLADPARRAELVQMLRAYDPAMSAGEAKSLAADLAKLADFETPVKYYRRAVKSAKPVMTALRPGIDVLFPSDTREIEEARWVAMPQLLTEPELRARAETEGWSKEWVEAAVERKGHAFGALFDNHLWMMAGGVPEMENDANWWRERIHVVEVFYRPMTQAGARAVYRTVVHPDVPEIAALHEIFDRAHGTMPFRAWAPNLEEPYLLACPSVPDLIESEQHQVKALVDGARNQLQIRTQPPMTGPALINGATVPKLKPGLYVPQAYGGAGGGYGWFPPPDTRNEMVQEMALIQERVARYFGLADQTVPPAAQQALAQERIDGWLGFVAGIHGLCGDLVQEFMDEVTTSQVAGMKVSLNVSREQIRGKAMFRHTCDVQNLDPESREKKQGRLLGILQTDTAAIIDRAALVREMMAQEDPALAMRVMKDPQTAAQDEAEQEQQALAVILSGQEPPQKAGVNAPLRLQIMQDAALNNPAFAQAMQQEGEAGDRMKAVFEARAKFYQQMVNQEKNKEIGRNEGRTVLPAPGGAGG